jgi:hypothetical protein
MRDMRRFHDIAWAKVKSEHGIIAGALENGSLDLWDADKLLDGGECVNDWQFFFGHFNGD